MAEFGIQATQLSAPQGAGSAPVNPVQETYVNDSILANPVVGSIVDIFAKGLTTNRKEEAEAKKNKIVQAYIREETSLNDATVSGQMTPTQAAARSRANFNKYMAGYGEYAEDFEKAGRALKGFSETGVTLDKLETEKKQREADIKQAQDRGFSFPAGMSVEAQDAQIRAVKTSIQSENAFSELVKRNTEARAQGNFDVAASEREMKTAANRLVTDIAGTHIDAFQALGRTLTESVRNGTETTESAKLKLQERFSRINGAIQSAAAVNPELAAPYRAIFGEANNLFNQMLDPKNVTEELNSQLQNVLTRAKLVATSDPKFTATVATSQLLGNNSSIAFIAAPQVSETIARIAKADVKSTDYVPQVVGNPDVESGTLTLLKSGISQLSNSKTPNVELQRIESLNSVNQILKQTGQFLNTNSDPAKLKGLADFFASPEYASLVTNNKLDPQAAGAAKKTFQAIYEPAIIQGVQTKFDNYLYGQAGNKNQPVPVYDAIDVQFTGSGITFKAANLDSLDPVERRSQAESVTELNSAQKGINQLIHIGAHMEGSTNYQKYWDENKHIFMPQIFPDPVKLKPGQVVDGYKYLGGAYKSNRNWEKVGG